MLIRAFALLVLLQVYATTIFAQPPELSGVVTANGDATASRFFAGASRNNGERYALEFNFDEAIDIDVKIDIEVSHQGSSGNIFLLILWNDTFFMRDQLGAYQPWNLQLDTLSPAISEAALTDSYTIKIADDLAFGPIGVSGVTLKIYAAYNSIKNPGDLIYTGNPLNVVINTHQTSENCAKALYSDFPAPSSVDSVHRYYNFSWQNDPFLCTNVYGDVPQEISSKVRAGLQFTTQKLGLLAPFNGFLLNFNLNNKDEYISAVCETFAKPNEPKALCIRDTPPLNYGRAGGGAGHEGIFNGGGSENSINAYYEQSVFWQEAGYSSEEAMREWYAKEIAKVSVHEFFHAHQQTLMWYFEDKKQFGIPISLSDNIASYRNANKQHDKVFYTPRWIEEGFAEFAAHFLMQQYDPSGPERKNIITMLDLLLYGIEVSTSRGDVVSLGDYEYETEIDLVNSENNPTGIPRNIRGVFDLGEWAAIYLWNKDPKNLQGILVDYWKNWGEQENAHPRQGWKYSFEKTFGLSIEDFYVEFDAFMKKPRDEILAILKTNEQVSTATFTPASR